MGTGRAVGERRAIEAAQQAISSPLLEDVSITGATGILINITGGPDLTLFEVNEASTLIQEAAHEDANIIFGAVLDDKMKDSVKITVIATGFKDADIIRRRQEQARTPFFSPRERVDFDDHEPDPMPQPVIMEQAVASAPVAEGIPVEPARTMVAANFQQDDLDVPAYLRKRNDVM